MMSRFAPSSTHYSYLADEDQDRDYVCFEVADSGVGIEPEVLKRIFDPFFTTKASGRGLGLSAVLGIIRGHRGAIEIDSAIGIGTSFRVYLPPAEQLTEADSYHGNGTILVVDDEPLVREVAGTMLEKIGFRVISVDDGYEALAAFRKHSSEVVAVLLDMTMPQMSGEDVCRELKSMSPGLPVILSSGYSRPEQRSDEIATEHVAFIQKPYDPRALIEMLRSVLY